MEHSCRCSTRDKSRNSRPYDHDHAGRCIRHRTPDRQRQAKHRRSRLRSPDSPASLTRRWGPADGCRPLNRRAPWHIDISRPRRHFVSAGSRTVGTRTMFGTNGAYDKSNILVMCPAHVSFRQLGLWGANDQIGKSEPAHLFKAGPRQTGRPAEVVESDRPTGLYPGLSEPVSGAANCGEQGVSLVRSQVRQKCLLGFPGRPMYVDDRPVIAIFLENSGASSEDMQRLASGSTGGFGLLPHDGSVAIDALALLQHFPGRVLRKFDVAAQMMACVLMTRTLDVARFIDRNFRGQQAECLRLVTTDESIMEGCECLFR